MLLADKSKFPRDKPCGGGLTMRAVRLLPFDVDPVVEDRTTRVRFGLDFKHRFERRLDDPLVLMTRRSGSMPSSPSRRRRPGRTFRDGVRVADLVASDHGVEATVDGTKIAANHTLLADGANGTSTRAVGLDDGRDYGVALEGNVPHGVASRDRYLRRMVIELGILPGGYGWVFPKGDHVNVGVGGWATSGPRLRDHLRRLCVEHGLPWDRVESLRGHRLPMRRVPTTLARGRALAPSVTLPAWSTRSRATGCTRGSSAAGSGPRRHSTSSPDGGRSSTPTVDELQRSLARLVAASWGIKAALDRFPRLSFFVVQAAVRVARDRRGHARRPREPARGERRRARADLAPARARAPCRRPRTRPSSRWISRAL